LPEGYDAVVRVWRRHEQRRRDAVPTVSILLSSEETERLAFEAALPDRTFLFSRSADTQALTSDWLSAVTEERDVLEDAFSFIAAELNEPEPELRAAWTVRSDRERWMWLERTTAMASPQLRAALHSLTTALAMENAAQDPLEKLRNLLSWLPGRETLTFGVEQAGPAALRSLLEFATNTPAWSLFATVAPVTWASIVEQFDDRSRTILGPGVLPTPSRPPASSGPPRAEIAAPDESASRRLEVLASEALSEARASSASRARDLEVLGERARSLAELRLFQLLEADATTRGLFQLNRRMPFSFGAARMEIDLVCVELRLAVEVDGYYHFRELTAYRRDRRKDVVLQHQGYLVSRHLATDVVERAGEVVRAIRTLVLRRRRTLQRENVTR
jgi:very-short-patch-repair endonuclease